MYDDLLRSELPKGRGSEIFENRRSHFFIGLLKQALARSLGEADT